MTRGEFRGPLYCPDQRDVQRNILGVLPGMGPRPALSVALFQTRDRSSLGVYHAYIPSAVPAAAARDLQVECPSPPPLPAAPAARGLSTSRATARGAVRPDGTDPLAANPSTRAEGMTSSG